MSPSGQSMQSSGIKANGIMICIFSIDHIIMWWFKMEYNKTQHGKSETINFIVVVITFINRKLLGHCSLRTSMCGQNPLTEYWLIDCANITLILIDNNRIISFIQIRKIVLTIFAFSFSARLWTDICCAFACRSFRLPKFLQPLKLK